MSAMIAIASTSCNSGGTTDDNANIIDKPTDLKIENRHYSIDVLEAFGRVNDPKVSPDGKKILFGISYESVEQNKSNNDLYVMNVDGTNQKRITRSEKSEGNAVWIDGGQRIAFTSSENGTSQIWVMNADGTDRKCISDIENGVDGFKFSPDQKKIVIISQLKYERKASDLYSDLPKSTGRVLDDMMYKHWNEWVTTIPHPFVGDFDGNKIANVIDIMGDEPFEAPMKPFGGIESLAWSPDSKNLVYVSRKKTGKEYALSTNS